MVALRHADETKKRTAGKKFSVRCVEKRIENEENMAAPSNANALLLAQLARAQARIAALEAAAAAANTTAEASHRLISFPSTPRAFSWVALVAALLVGSLGASAAGGGGCADTPEGCTGTSGLFHKVGRIFSDEERRQRQRNHDDADAVENGPKEIRYGRCLVHHRPRWRD